MIGLIIAAAALASEPTVPIAASQNAAPAAPTAQPIGSTGETVYTGTQIKTMGGKLPKLLSIPEEPDVDHLHKQGIQGEMYFVGYVGADGKMHDVTLSSSTRSKELDSIGLSLVNASTFTAATDASGQPIATKVTFPVYLWKDSMLDPAFLKKKCAQFIIDANWYATAFSEKKPDEYRGWLLFTGLMVASRYSRTEKVGPLPEFDEVYAKCQARPNMLFVDAYMRK